MSYIGKWVFHSIGTFNEEDEMVYLNAEEYLKAPMPYVDESDEEAVADEMNERRKMIASQIAVVEDGSLYMLMPLPEGVTKEQVDEAVKAGHIKLYDGMMTDEPTKWEERDGALRMYAGEGMSEDGWVTLSEDGSFINFINSRYVKAE